jgi:hypothetical protein
MASLALSNAFLVAVFFLGVALVVLWIALPFAVFGVKSLLRELLGEVRRTNELLERGLPPKR